MNKDQSHSQEPLEPLEDQLMDALLREQAFNQREKALRDIDNAIMADKVVHPIHQPNVDWKRLIISGSVAAAFVLGFGYFIGASVHPRVEAPTAGTTPEKEEPMLITYQIKYKTADRVVETQLPRQVAQKQSVDPFALSQNDDQGNQSFPEMAISPLSPELGGTQVSTNPPSLEVVEQSPSRLVDQNWRTPLSQPLSRFSLDVENASYANIRHLIREGHPVPKDVVFIEECINAFAYDYEAPLGEEPFAIQSNIVTCPWNDRHMLVKVAIKARDAEQHGGAAIIAKDAAIQIEFNPQRVESYRLIGYANSLGEAEDAGGPQADGVDIRTGQVVTAIYEVMPLRPVMATPRPGERLKYQRPTATDYATGPKDEWLSLNLVYKLPEQEKISMQQSALKGEATMWHLADVDSRFASTVALFGMKLRGMDGLEGITWDHVLAMAEYGGQSQTKEDRAEFIGLVKALKTNEP